MTLPTWLPVTSRVLAALVGGYAFTYALTAALGRLLPLHPMDAMVVATLPSFALYTLAILWAFAARDAWWAWGGAALALPLAGIGFWPQLLEHLG